jgi:hypothetical protein
MGGLLGKEVSMVKFLLDLLKELTVKLIVELILNKFNRQ